MPSIDKAYQWVINTCNAANVGYPSNYQWRNQSTVNGITYYDCSSLMYYGLINGGFDLDPNAWPFVTWTMPAILLDLGFTQFDPRTTVLLPGDILVDDWRDTKLQHTEMVYKGPEDGTTVNYGWFMGAHGPAPYYSLADQVSIDSGYAHAYGVEGWFWFNKGFRWGSGGASGYGASKYVVAAICGNWWRESLGLSPGVYENLQVVPLKDNNVYGGYGLGQWTNNPLTGNTRRTHLANWLDDHGYAYDDGYGQLDFFLHEDEANNTGVWQAAGIYGQQWADIYPDFESFMTSTSTDLRELTEAFLNCWEIGNTGLDIRYAYALKALAIIENQGNMHPLTWVTGNRYLDEDESLNNCLLIWDYLSAGGGGGGKLPYHSYSKMPVWMMVNYYLI